MPRERLPNNVSRNGHISAGFLSFGDIICFCHEISQCYHTQTSHWKDTHGSLWLPFVIRQIVCDHGFTTRFWKVDLLNVRLAYSANIGLQ
jgi:hypothetical protein